MPYRRTPASVYFFGMAKVAVDGRNGAVEGGVEAGNLRQIGPVGSKCLDGSHILRLMQRSKRRQTGQLFDDLVIDEHRLVEGFTTMHNAVTGADQRQVSRQLAFDPLEQMRQDGRNGALIQMLPRVICQKLLGSRFYTSGEPYSRCHRADHRRRAQSSARHR